MLREFLQPKTLIYFIFLFAANAVFFLWRDSIDTIVAFRHLMICAVWVCCLLTVAYAIKLFRFSGYNIHYTDIGIAVFTILVLTSMRGSFIMLLYDQNVLTYIVGAGMYAAIRLYAKDLSVTKGILWVFTMLLLAVEIGFLLVEGAQRINNSFDLLQPFRGSFNNSGKMGIYLAMLYPFSLKAFIERKEKAVKTRTLLIFVFIFLNVFLLMSLSRTAWTSAIVSVAVIIPWYIGNKKKRRLWYLLAAVLGVFTIWLILSIKQNSASGRTLIWNITIQHLADFCFTGVDYGRFSAVYNLWQAEYFSTSGTTGKYFYIADNTFFAFNELLQTAVELGWLGVLLWIVLLVYVVVHSFKKSIWAVSLLGFLIACLTSYPFRETQHELLFFHCLRCSPMINGE